LRLLPAHFAGSNRQIGFGAEKVVEAAFANIGPLANLIKADRDAVFTGLITEEYKGLSVTRKKLSRATTFFQEGSCSSPGGLVTRQLTLVLISSLPGTAGLQPFIFFSTSCNSPSIATL
jgi:hypothetical protein